MQTRSHLPLHLVGKPPALIMVPKLTAASMAKAAGETEVLNGNRVRAWRSGLQPRAKERIHSLPGPAGLPALVGVTDSTPGPSGRSGGALAPGRSQCNYETRRSFVLRPCSSLEQELLVHNSTRI